MNSNLIVILTNYLTYDTIRLFRKPPGNAKSKPDHRVFIDA